VFAWYINPSIQLTGRTKKKREREKTTKGEDNGRRKKIKK